MKVLNDEGKKLGIKIIGKDPLTFSVPFSVMVKEDNMNPKYYEEKYFKDDNEKWYTYQKDITR